MSRQVEEMYKTNRAVVFFGDYVFQAYFHYKETGISQDVNWIGLN